MVSMIAALGRDRGIGKGPELLWHIPEDLKRFKKLTLGHPVVMGRKTFESIAAALGSPLPERQNIVVSRDSNWHYDGVLSFSSVEEAIGRAQELDAGEVFVIGGGQIYEAALPFTDKLYLTLIDDEKEADAFFPPYEKIFTKEISREEHEWNGLRYAWVDLEK